MNTRIHLHGTTHDVQFVLNVAYQVEITKRDGRQKQAGENGENGDNDKKLNESEGKPTPNVTRFHMVNSYT
jgi:hypothetical protein